MKFCQVFKDLRKDKNLLQQEIAIKINITRSTISDWENERSEPNIDQLLKLSDFFNCSIDFLLGREDDFGNVTAHPELSEREKTLLNYFNQLSDSRQEVILETMSDMVEAKKAKNTKKANTTNNVKNTKEEA